MTEPNLAVPAEFTGHGRRTWQDTRSLLDGCTCTWTDLDGLQLAPAPPEVPITTHLWAWDGARCFRARVDQDDIHLAELRLGSGTDTAYRRHVTLRRDTVDVALDVLELPGEHPITFLRPADR